MDRRLLAVDGVYFAGILVTVLGLVHCVVTPLMMKSTFTLLLPEDAHTVLFTVLATGLATSFAGTLLVTVSKDMRGLQPWAWRLAWRTALFLFILGAGGLIVARDNPFAQILLVVDVLLFFLLAKSRALLKPDPNKEWPKGTGHRLLHD